MKRELDDPKTNTEYHPTWKMVVYIGPVVAYFVWFAIYARAN